MMTKREYTAIAVLALLLALSVWNLKSIDTLTGDIEIALSKSQSAAEKLLLPVNTCANIVVGVAETGVGALARRTIELLEGLL